MSHNLKFEFLIKWSLKLALIFSIYFKVLEIRPKSVQHLPMGTRVCAVWSSAYICLFPGTITHPDEPLPDGHVLVELDDGDSRLVEMSKIRMLPADYSRVGKSTEMVLEICHFDIN